MALFVVLPILGLSGCKTTPVAAPSSHGSSYRSFFDAQVINSAAPANPAAADTLPGDIANQIYRKRYVKSLTEEKKDKDNVQQLDTLN